MADRSGSDPFEPAGASAPKSRHGRVFRFQWAAVLIVALSTQAPGQTAENPQVVPVPNPPSTVTPARLPSGDSSPGLRGLSSIARNRAAYELGPDEDLEFPNIFAPPGERYGFAKDEYDPFLFPWAVNLIHEDRWNLEHEAENARKRRLRRIARVDIRDPDPDTANFPNGAYTLPKGRVYLENSPVGFYGPSRITSAQYNWEYLFRYGMTDNLEFRIFSSGLSVTKGQHPTTGYSPLAFDFKINFWEENRKYLIPAVGMEVYITTNFGSPAFNAGTQPSLNLLLDHTLPFEINFEHNFSLSGRPGYFGESIYEFGYSWSFQRQLVKDFDIFTHGFYNASSLPRIRDISLSLADQASFRGRTPTTVVVGAGAIWTVNNRLAIFGSYNVGLTQDSPTTIAQLGFALAF